MAKKLLIVAILAALTGFANSQNACSICDDTESITNPEVVIPKFFTAGHYDVDTACETIESDGESGAFDDSQCATIKKLLSGPCGCMGVAPEPTAPVPTPAPVAPTTASPTAAPTLPEVSQNVAVTLEGVSGELTPEGRTAFEEGCQAFMTENFPDVTDINCEVVVPAARRRLLRALQDSDLEIVFRVTGKATALDALSTAEEVVASKSDEFLAALQEADPTFFADLAAVSESDLTAPPTMAPATDEGSDDPRFSTEELIGICLGGAGGALILLFCVYFLFKQQPTRRAQVGRAAPISSSTASTKPKSAVTYAGRTSPPSSSASGNPADRAIITALGSDPGSVIGRDGGDASTAGSSVVSLQQNYTTRTVRTPPGKLGIVIDSTMDGPRVHRVNPTSVLKNEVFPGDLIVAVDEVDTRAMSPAAITALMLRTSNRKRILTILSADVSDESVLARPDVAAVPPPIEESVEEEEEPDVSSGGVTNYFSRTIEAPPGKLGIVIDTTNEGPKVYRVNENSALKGKIRPGDIIVEADGVDTRSMSASEITALFVSTSDRQRQLTVLSEEE